MVQRHRPKQRSVSKTAAGVTLGAVAMLFGTVVLMAEVLL